MHKTYEYETYAYEPSPEQLSGEVTRHPVVVVGAGPAGLTAANDLAHQGVKVVLLDDDNQVSTGSRAICFAKRTLEVFDRLGCAEPMRAKGVTWNTGKVFFRDKETYRFDLLPEKGHAHPAFINLQQYYVEEYLIEALLEHPNVDVRWLNELVGLEAHTDHVRLTIETPEGVYETEAEYVIACDGARSQTRKLLNLDYGGLVFEEKFLITDVVMQNVDFPAERWFWFDPPFNRGYSALLHSQPDDVWRIDLQLGRDADPVEEIKPRKVIPRIKAMLGENVEFDVEWISIYSFHSRMLDRFVHGRVIFAGDAAHIMSPFGARGANSGVQDVDNLVWKLKLVLDGRASEELLESYDHERVHAARENLLYTESSTEFISPNTAGQMALRNAVLELAEDYEFARPLINSGRLSTATPYPDSPLNTADEDAFEGQTAPGAACTDAPITLGGERTYLLKQIGNTFNGLLYLESLDALDAAVLADLKALAEGSLPIHTRLIVPEQTDTAAVEGFPVCVDVDGYARERYDFQDGTFYLTRPDQYVVARWRSFEREKVAAALAKAACLQTVEA